MQNKKSNFTVEVGWLVHIETSINMDTSFKAAESVSFRNYCMWIFLFYKKLHMSKLSIKVELIPQHKPFYEFPLLAFVLNTTLSVAFYSLYNSVTEEIRTAMSI